jgi:hypothetical protein
LRGDGVHLGLVEERAAVGPPLRIGGAVGIGGKAARLAAVERQQVDLGRFVTFPFGGEGERLAIGREDGAGLRPLGRGEALRRRAAVGRDDPEVAHLPGGVVVGLDHGEDKEPSVGAHRRVADALHGPDVGVRDGPLLGGERRGQHGQPEEDSHT